MLLTLLSASIIQRSENGTHYKWDVHSSLPSRRYRERAGPWCLPQKLDCSDSIFFPPLPTLSTSPFTSPYSPTSPVLVPQNYWRYWSVNSVPFSPNWHWNSYSALLYLFPAAAIALAHNRNDCYRTTPFSVLPLISFFLPLKDDPFCCHKRNESFLWLLWIMPHSHGPFLNVQILVAAG